jgi:rhodanese-related sulfurtransferase
MYIKPFLPLAALAAISIAAPSQAAEVPSISHKALVKAIKTKKVTILDVNGTESFKAGRIPGAINFETAQANLKARLPRNKKALIVAYCGSPQCGAYKQGAEAARKLGYTNIKHYSPGISGWVKSGARVVKG